MVKHHLKLAYRNSLRNKSTFFINLIGLSTGLACALLIFLWVYDELSVDKFHEKDAQLFQVMKQAKTSNGETLTFKWTPAPLAAAMKTEMPEVKLATSCFFEPDAQKGIVKIGESHLKAMDLFTQPDFFQMFSYHFLEGDKNQVLKTKNEVLISDQFAKKVFGTTTNLIGKTINYEKDPFSGIYNISGVFQKPPTNATQQFDLVFNFDLMLDSQPDMNKWTYGGPDTYILLEEGTNFADFNQKMQPYLETKTGEAYQSLFIRPFSDQHLYNKYENGKQAGGRIEYVWLFSIIALFVLIIACINFMNLSTAKAMHRTKEVGVKKVIGASRSYLITQYMVESILLTLISLVIGLILVALVLPQFNGITDKQIGVSFDPELIFGILGITIMTGVISGSYPALYLSSFNPVAIFKGKINRSVGEVWARKGLVVFQFSISIILIISVTVIYNQIQFVQNKNLGFNKDQVLIFKKDGKLANDSDSFLKEIKNISGVVNASSVRSNLINNSSSTIGVKWEGLTEDNSTPFKYLSVGYDLIELLDIELLEGRSFSEKFGDEKDKIIFNETAIKTMGVKNPIGKTVRQWGKDKQIIGVVKDFHMESLYEKVKPCFFNLTTKGNDLVVKIQAGAERETIAQLSAFYKKFNDGLPFEFEFLDANYQSLYASEQRVATLSKYFAGIAILISCLGLFGLVTFSAQRRIKEIGIRKVLGASVTSIVHLLSKDFLQLIVFALFISIPIAWYFMNNWLNSFAYHIEMDYWMFALTGVFTIGIAFITVASQSLKSALMNPVDTIKNE
ncbi:MAG: ABC transporter permease [Saprospiraceae bacterium]